MEKYKKFTDAGTGINPFVPFRRKGSDPFLLSLVRFLLLSLPLILLKIPIFIIFLLDSQFLVFVSYLIPLAVLRRTFTRYSNFLVCRSFLLFCGFLNIEVNYVSPSNRKQTISPIERLKRFTRGIPPGDLIIANHISYVELLFLTARYSPVFANIVYHEKKQEVRVVSQSFLGYFMSTILQRKPDAEQGERLSQVILRAKNENLGPVVVFPEAVTSNGRCILKFQNPFDRDFVKTVQDNNIQTHVMAFQFEYANFSPCYHIRGFLWHFLSLSAQIYNKMKVKITTIEIVSEGSLQAVHIRDTLELLSGVKQVSLGMTDKQQFSRYWDETQRSSYFRQ